ncbi:hypothetical protein H4R23_003665 [Coemansia sp. Cherry 401B]|nr:hypothetical protein IWW54_004059 [Coemansia sp. RSA 2705]KAJ2728337.1 hypothetical protein H4R23_003665 [Coemansia sp. Cherry 401B]
MKLSTIALATVATAGSGALGLEKPAVDRAAVTASAYSFVTSILVDGASSTKVCAGALISPTVVLTSAYCVADPVSNKALASNRVAVGQGKLSGLLGGSAGSKIELTDALAVGYTIPKTVTVHPGYNSIANSDNIAVLTLAQPLANATSANVGVKLIKKPSATTNAAYIAVGWSETMGDISSYSDDVLQNTLAVGSKSMCSDIWAPYTNLTNSLCLAPVKEGSNVCDGDGLLVKVATDSSIGLAGILNMVATEDDVPTSKCTDSGAVDFFTTFGNYLAWLTQVTPLKETDFVSTASFSYDSAVSGDEQSSDSESSSSSEEDSMDDVESDTSAAGPSLKFAMPLAAIASAALGALF